MLLIVAYEVSQLLLSALQRGVKLLHLVHQVGLLRFQTLTVRLHGCDELKEEKAREKSIESYRQRTIEIMFHLGFFPAALLIFQQLYAVNIYLL